MSSAPASRPSRGALLGIGATLMIIATMAAVLAPRAPTVRRVAQVSLAAPTRSAPDDARRFPGFQAVGARTDTIEGRRAITVTYRRNGVELHYALVDGDPLALPGEGDVVADRAGALALVAFEVGGQTAVLASEQRDGGALERLVRPA